MWVENPNSYAKHKNWIPQKTTTMKSFKNEHSIGKPFKLISHTVLIFAIIFGSSFSSFSQTTNAFSCFVQDQNERHHYNTPHQVLAFYYGWYGNPQNEPWGKVDNVKHETERTAHFPVKGAYSTHDPAIIDWQIDQAKTHGITGFIVSWWGLAPWDKWHDDSLALLLQRAQKKDFKVSCFWERAVGEGDDQIRQAVRDISYVLNRYGKSDAFLKVDGEPVIFVYGRVLEQVPVESWPAIIKGVRSQAGSFSIIADGYDERYAYLFDGIDSYTLDGFPSEFERELGTKFGEYRKWLAWYNQRGVKIARAHGKIFCAMVGPGFDARKAYKIDYQTDRLNGQTYRAMWEEALKSNPDWVTISTWNEWPEGTEIEPSLELGGKYLQITADYAEPFLKGHPVTLPASIDRLPMIAPGTTNELDKLLTGQKFGVLIQDQMNDSEFWAAYCGATPERLTITELIDQHIFNASNFPAFIYIAGEHYASSVKVTDDVTQALVRYLHQGGFLICLPTTGPWPIYYDDSRNGIPFNITDKLALGVDSGFDKGPGGPELKLFVNKSALHGLPPIATFPSGGDVRFRPASRLRVPNADYYLPLVQLWGDQTTFYGDAGVYVEHRSLLLRPGKSIYIWMRTAEAIGPDKFYPSLYEFISTKLKMIHRGL
jgi:hypothetical protein